MYILLNRYLRLFLIIFYLKAFGFDKRGSEPFIIFAIAELQLYPLDHPRTDDQTNRSILGKPFTIMQKIIGRPMASIIELSPIKTRDDMMRLFCSIFVDLHRLDAKPFLSDKLLIPDPSIYDSPEYYIKNIINTARQMLITFKNTGFKQILDWFEHKNGDISRGRLSPTHLDNTIIIY